MAPSTSLPSHLNRHLDCFLQLLIHGTVLTSRMFLSFADDASVSPAALTADGIAGSLLVQQRGNFVATAGDLKSGLGGCPWLIGVTLEVGLLVDGSLGLDNGDGARD